MADSSFDQALALALRLPAQQRLRLLREIASSLKQELPDSLPEPESLDSEDSGEWLRYLRAQEEEHRFGDWGS